MDIWTPLLGERLKYAKEPDSIVVEFRLNSERKEVVVGHVPMNISKYISMFLTVPNCSSAVLVCGKRINRGGGCGFDIPSCYYFYGPRKAINWVREKVLRVEGHLNNSVGNCLK